MQWPKNAFNCVRTTHAASGREVSLCRMPDQPAEGPYRGRAGQQSRLWVSDRGIDCDRSGLSCRLCGVSAGATVVLPPRSSTVTGDVCTGASKASLRWRQPGHS